MDSKYTKQAQDFLNKTKTTLEIDYIGHGHHFDDDKETRDIYRFTLIRDGRKYTAKFGQSIVRSGTAKENFKTSDAFRRSGKFTPSKPEHFERKRQAPTAYDILACLTKYEVGTFEDFCSEFGYDTDSRKAEKVYFAVQQEYAGLCRIWNAKEREELAEIN